MADLLAVALAQGRVQPQGRGFGRLGKHPDQLRLPCLQRLHLCLHRRVIHVVFDRRQDTGDLPLDLCQLPAAGIVIAAAPPSCFVEGQAVGLDEGRDQLRMHQPVA
ncbi:hypothetical protein [Paracoccus hibiscisoli]|uniref:hypothetical protein n=1 Tax=Paracoccus hibiscisoli TaxID=2023261 RepID=UPI001FE56475|nr:hypothetical protein [Paracoccus hibiscisoli]